MKKITHFIFTLFLIFLSNTVVCQVNETISKPKIERASQAYGYIIGQENAILHIKKLFPEYNYDLLKTEMEFKLTFGKARINLEKFLLEQLKENSLNEFKEELFKEIQKNTDNLNITKEIAINFIDELNKRAKGDIPSPILETLLSFQYLETPSREMIDGFYYTFKTKGHPKSKSTDWQIRVPKSWKAKEADRPNIIKNFIDDYGDGSRGAMLMVKDISLPKGKKYSKLEIQNLFTEKEIKKMVPEGGKFISFTKMVIDNNVGGMLEMEQTTMRLDNEIKIRLAQFMFFRNSKLYILYAYVSTSDPSEQLTNEMEKYMPLFKLIANSIVVNEQYEK